MEKAMEQAVVLSEGNRGILCGAAEEQLEQSAEFNCTGEECDESIGPIRAEKSVPNSGTASAALCSSAKVSNCAFEADRSNVTSSEES